MSRDGISVSGIEPLNILNKQTRKSDNGRSSILGFYGVVNPSLLKISVVEDATSDLAD